MAAVKDWMLGIVLAALLAGLLFGCGFFVGKASMSRDLGELSGSVEQQNTQAQATLDRLTRERDEKQAELDQQAEDQEKKDAAAKAEIDRLAGELERRPFRVRVVTQAGSCDRGAAGEGAADTAGGDRDTGPAYGVLPPENTRRLDAALIEVETLSRAYSQCRARLLPGGG